MGRQCRPGPGAVEGSSETPYPHLIISFINFLRTSDRTTLSFSFHKHKSKLVTKFDGTDQF